MGSSSPKVLEEKDIYNNAISIPTSALKVILDLADKCICKIQKVNEEKGTVFFCAIPFPDKYQRLPVLITNNHILKESDITPGKKIKFSINNEQLCFEIEIDNDRIKYTSETYDVTIIEIKKNKDKLNIDCFLDVDEQIFNDNPQEIFKRKSVYLLHYPHGNLCEYTSGIIKAISLDEIYINHSCQSQPGSSGSPILNLINHKVIGIHKGSIENENSNVSIFLRAVINDFNKKSKKEINNNIKSEIISKNEILEKIFIYEKEDENDVKILNDIYCQNFYIIEEEYLKIFLKNLKKYDLKVLDDLEDSDDLEELEDPKNITKNILKETLNFITYNYKRNKKSKFNKEEYQEYLKYKEIIDPLIIPSINLDDIKKKYKNKEYKIENLSDLKFIYEKKVENLNKIILLFNESLNTLPKILVNFNKNRTIINKSYYSSYLDSIGFNTKPFDNFVFTISENFLFHKHLIIYLKKKLNDGFQFLDKYKSGNLNDNNIFKEIIRLAIYPLYKIKILQEKFNILKLDISPLDICIDLIQKIKLVKTEVIQHNYHLISI